MVHRIDETKIKEEAKKLLDKFASALEKVEKEHEIDFYTERDEFERHEGKAMWPKKNFDAFSFGKVNYSKFPVKDFKKRILNNAPKKDDNFIIAEKGDWK